MNLTAQPVVPQYGTDHALAFLEGRGEDGAGRTIDEYFTFDNDKWEECHNHVQWAFPSHIMSRFNLNAPVVDMEAFSLRLTAVGHANVMTLVHNYLISLGFTHDSGGWHSNVTADSSSAWVSPRNHNYQRISRLLNLLSWLDPELAMDLLNVFLDVSVIASEWNYFDGKGFIPFIEVDTVVYWTKAAIGRL
jgi:hypothetical protein